MKRFHLIFILLVALIGDVTGQETEFPFGKPTQAEFEMIKYAQDTTAGAVVLREFGNAYISNGEQNNLIFEYHVRVKIFNEKEFKQGNVTIPLQRNDANTLETVRDVEGVTFYPDEQGLIRKTELDPKQVFHENRSKYTDLAKFAMPNLRPGCIIEYKYTVESPFLFNFRKWEFQSDIPKVYSEYLAHIPAVYNYNITLRGPYKLTKSTGKVEKECFQPGGGFKADCSAMTYAMADVPAFIEEDNMTAASNFLSAMYFELSDWTDYHGVKHQITQEWKNVDREMKIDDQFGGQLKKKDFFKDKLVSVTGATSDPLQRAKLIYEHMQKWFRWNGYYGKYTETGVKKAYDSHTGNVGDINLTLTAALLSAGLDAEAVMLSTRNNGLVNKLFPVMSDFNYVIAKVNINGQSYLLDATEPLLPFGLLPLRCINGEGRVMSLDKASYWTELTASQKESRVCSMDLVLGDDGKIKGKAIFISSGYAGFNKREAIKKYSSTDEYVEKMAEKMPKIKITHSAIENIDSLDLSLTEEYDIEINAFDGLNRDRLLFNPYILDRVTENPFKLAERTYPVDRGAPTEVRFSLQLTFPEKFEISSMPAPVGLALPANGGRFVMQAGVEGNRLNLYQLTQLNKSVYESEEYPYLKELFNKIVLSQKADIILKKKI